MMILMSMGLLEISCLGRISAKFVSNNAKTLPMPESSHISITPAYMLVKIGETKQILSIMPFEESMYIRMYQTKLWLSSLACLKKNQMVMIPQAIKKLKVINHLSKQDSLPLDSKIVFSLKEHGKSPKKLPIFSGVSKAKSMLELSILIVSEKLNLESLKLSGTKP